MFRIVDVYFVACECVAGFALAEKETNPIHRYPCAIAPLSIVTSDCLR
jgi:hypothetical protein